MIEGILQVLFSPAFFTVDICLDHIPHQRDLDATVARPKRAETRPKRDAFEAEKVGR